SLLNPCNCRSVSKCKCRVAGSSPPYDEVTGAGTGLAALARAAALCVNAKPHPSPASPRKSPVLKRQTSRPAIPNHPSRKRPKHINTERVAPGPDLSPIQILYNGATPSPSIPSFPSMPPISMITLLAGSGCACGLECTCSSCVEQNRKSGALGVGARAGIALPGIESASTFTSIIDQFLARAAVLPAPPSNRKMAGGLRIDPMNVMLYPTAARQSPHRGIPFGLVELPKL
ncbi:hypothetical protein DFH09DRAFT_903995, partial [Mycena vulgaris]